MQANIFQMPLKENEKSFIHFKFHIFTHSWDIFLCGEYLGFSRNVFC